MNSVFQIVTEQIVKQLQSGVAPWRKPWSTSAPRNLVTQKDYRGLNVFLLASQGYASPYWLTFNQCQRLGGRIRQGEHSTLVTFWKFGEHVTEDPQTGEDETHTSVLLRYYRVFNLAQTEGIADKLNLAQRPRVPSIRECERIVAGMPNPPAREQSDRAWYRPSCDTVGMPARDSFHSAEEYYSTLFHELTHSTGHPSRIGREGIEKLNTFGSESYSKEELIAELGAAMLCGICGISPATIENSASYLQSWISVLKSDSRMIVSASSSAQKAADFILGKQPKTGGEA
ncbi:MAG TPA: zincin-like metallopeptidase domain-containing protein [Candidatus Acidoferrales bacterium]|nr:zincin-like metallopeptidase domain-containing protein [Candidatus Acidoferrales bacterium]